MKKALKIILATILVIILVRIGFFVYDCFQYAKAVQNDTQRIFKEKKDYIVGLSFDGIIAEKESQYGRYFTTILLNQIEPEPSPVDKRVHFYMYYHLSYNDSLLSYFLTMEIPQNIYNQIEKEETVVKKTGEYSLEIEGKKMLVLSSDKNKWLSCK